MNPIAEGAVGTRRLTIATEFANLDAIINRIHRGELRIDAIGATGGAIDEEAEGAAAAIRHLHRAENAVAKTLCAFQRAADEAAWRNTRAVQILGQAELRRAATAAVVIHPEIESCVVARG